MRDDELGLLEMIRKFRDLALGIAALLCIALPATAQIGPSPPVIPGTPPGPWQILSSFGAKCDGSTNDTAAIQAWINAVISTGHPGYAGPGTCMASALSIDVSSAALGVWITGAGAGQTIFKQIGGTNADFITYTGAPGFGNQSHSLLQNLSINGNYPSNTSGDALHLADISAGPYPQGPTIEHVTVINGGRDNIYIGTGELNGIMNDVASGHPGRNALTNVNAGDWKIHESYFYAADQAGLLVTGAANNGGLIQLVVANGLTTGQVVNVINVGGVPNATGQWTVTADDVNHLTLQGSTWAGGFTASRGRVVPVFGISNVVSAGGLCSVTTTQNHGWSTGQLVLMRLTGGAQACSGVFTVTVTGATTFTLDNSVFGGAVFSAGTVEPTTVGIRSNPSNQYGDVNVYNNDIGMDITSNSANGVQYRQGELNGNWFGGLFIASGGILQPDVFGDTNMADNSAVQTNLYSDINLFDTGGEALSAVSFYKANSVQAKYLVQTDGLCVGSVLFTMAADQSGSSRQPWSTGLTNEVSGSGGCGLPGARNAVNMGARGTAGGTSAVNLGFNTLASAQGSLGAGNFGHDNANRSFVFGGGQFSAAGDDQFRVIVESQVITTGTTGRLTTDQGAASSINCHNIRFDGENLFIPSLDVFADIPGTTDTAYWHVDHAVFHRTNSTTAVVMFANGVVYNTASPAALSALAPTVSTAAFATSTLAVAADSTNVCPSLIVSNNSGSTIHAQAFDIAGELK